MSKAQTLEVEVDVAPAPTRVVVRPQSARMASNFSLDLTSVKPVMSNLWSIERTENKHKKIKILLITDNKTGHLSSAYHAAQRPEQLNRLSFKYYEIQCTNSITHTRARAHTVCKFIQEKQ